MSLVVAGRCRYTAPLYLFLGNLLPEPDADEDEIDKYDKPKQETPAAEAAHHRRSVTVESHHR